MAKSTQLIRIYVSTLNKLKRLIPPRKDEAMTHYFERVKEKLENE